VSLSKNSIAQPESKGRKEGRGVSEDSRIVLDKKIREGVPRGVRTKGCLVNTRKGGEGLTKNNTFQAGVKKESKKRGSIIPKS